MDSVIKSSDEYMHEALIEAKKAFALGEIPIGAVVVKDGQIIGRGHNLVETGRDATLHAEMIAIREASRTLGGWRLSGSAMYVTTEPCTMCAGAIIASRIPKLVIGTTNTKAGACVSLKSLLQDNRLNHSVELEIGVLRRECQEILTSFFANLRNK